MKIGNSPELSSTPVGVDKPAAAQTGRTAANGGGAPVGGKKTPEASAKLELSTNATQLLQGVPDDGSFDAAKVGRISQAITEGKFTVNANVIAEKLIANAQEMLGRMTPH
ncbi:MULTISPECIES: flagellar biosynthesis anti-sigma factor FlgM [Roseateles]|uniref:Negative regulator of flagellin synthesis n=1 Tax=Roseateles albus TaxID=2987525 RepID=A0ABT5KLN1_9BURK|nr:MULTISPECIES: flagellar biosynthesis anti-sigma factor FlgM [Roseateles]MCV2359210.1 flagellar biosynthesis anti-sigma factor FlgM [Paucibacter sp. TC2R-5]MDC8773761.1 flagellar biosynthesis anti-sigma factor FlgM [Roseateles albus]